MFRRFDVSLLLAIVAFIAGCGRINQSEALPASGAMAAAIPSPCHNQLTKKKYAQLTVMLKTRESAFCIPSFHGYGGTLQYPAVKPSIQLVVRSATANLYGDPELGSGTPMFYLNLHFLASTNFASKFRPTGGLTGTKIESGQPYTAYGIVTVGHLARMLMPCYTVATQGSGGGVLANLGYLLSGATITGNGYGVIEIYSGAQVTQAC